MTERRIHPVLPDGYGYHPDFTPAQAEPEAAEGDSWLPAWLFASPAATCAAPRQDRRRCCTPGHLAAPLDTNRRGEPASDAAAEDDAETPRDRMARRKRATLLTIVVVWLASGAWVFSGMKPAKAPDGPVEIIYLMVQIITTVGYGDFVPASQEEKLAVTAIVMSSTLLVSNIVMAFVAEYVDKGADELASDMEAMTDKISALKRAEEERASVDVDRPTLELMAPNDLAVRQQEQRWQRTRTEVSVSAAAFFVCLGIGVVFFKLVDRCPPVDCELLNEERVHTWVDALYMSVITMTTVGFGDIVPQSKLGRGFAALWILVGVAVTVRLLGGISSVIDQGLRADVRSEMTRQLFHESDENGDGHLDEMEFMKLQLVQNGLASKFQIEAIRTQFRLIAGSDLKISMDEYAAYFLPKDKEAVKKSQASRWFRRRKP